jgi:hypothetical protein
VKSNAVSARPERSIVSNRGLKNGAVLLVVAAAVLGTSVRTSSGGGLQGTKLSPNRSGRVADPFARPAMSAFGGKADIEISGRDVCF